MIATIEPGHVRAHKVQHFPCANQPIFTSDALNFSFCRESRRCRRTLLWARYLGIR